MLRSAVWLLTLASALTVTPADEVLPGCIDPPANGAIAEVVVNALEAARPYFLTGLPNLGVPPLDPLGPLPSLSFHVNNEALILDGSVNDTTVRNLAQFIICQVNVSVGLKPKFYIEFRLDNFHADGLYDVDGLAVSLFPIFGNGNYTLDTYQAGFKGSATVNYNVLQDRLSISDLELDVFFEELELMLECILGCGDMADFMNNFLSEIGQSIFDAVWEAVQPIFSQAVEDVINNAFENVSISEIIPMSLEGELGNANNYMDLVMRLTNNKLTDSGMDPLSLPDSTLDLGSGDSAELRNGTLTGLSTLRRSGTATVDTVADWHFLYANIAVGPLQAQYHGEVISSDGTADSFDASLGLEVVDVYITARADTFSGVFDLDQFVISDLGPVEVDIEGLGVLGWMVEALTESLTNLFLDEIQAVLSEQVKDAIQQTLNENPWPSQ